MNKRLLVICLAVLIMLPLAIVGCKSKVEKAEEIPTVAEMPEVMTQQTAATMEPAQTVATETIPPTAAVPQQPIAKTAVSATLEGRNKDIQTALKNAGFYAGSVDGKIGPRTKKAIEDFQKSKGLKADGKVGPKTWAALEQYLVQQ